MGPESIVYGCIRDWPGDDILEQYQRRVHNLQVIEDLPPGRELPLLCRQMFSSCHFESDDLSQGQVIHFGASYQGVEYEWSEWINQFEQLLGQLYWCNAVVHLETEIHGNHTFRWENQRGFHQPGDGVLQMRCEWEHEGMLRV